MARHGATRRERPGPGPRGYPGPGGGMASLVEAAPEWRGTSVQVCGLWPFSAGSGTPMVGVPVGLRLDNGATLCMDPLNWFARAGLISNPSMMVLGMPGLGKSTLVRRITLGLAAQGVRPLILGDLKPDYADLIAALGGQVIRVGRGLGQINPLDPGEMGAAAARLSGPARQRLVAEAAGRRLNIVSALITIIRHHPPTDQERTVLQAALRVLDTRHGPTPAVLPDLIKVLDEGPEPVRAVTLHRGSEERYRAATDGLHASLIGLLDGPMGEVFAGPTTARFQIDNPGGACVDISGIDEADAELQAAVLLACWSDGFGAIEAAHALADAGLGPRRRFFVVLDELWRVLGAGQGLVARVDALTRLNRQVGVAQAMITHTTRDLMAVQDAAEREKARGFVERSGVVALAGLPAAEMPSLTQAVRMSAREQRMVADWSTPPSWDPNFQADPPGRGRFLIKVGSRPGIPVKVELVPAELAVNDTNKLWHEQASR